MFSFHCMPRIVKQKYHVTEDGTEQRLSQLKITDLKELSGFARSRLLRSGLSPALGDDVAQSALSSVLLGIRTQDRGRHPRPEDLGSHAEFMRYLKGAICSGVDALKRRQSRFSVCELDENSFAISGGNEHEAEKRDFLQQLFRAIEQQSEPRLKPLVREWANTWESINSVPTCGLHRRARQKLRNLAKTVVAELSRGSRLNPPANLKTGF